MKISRGHQRACLDQDFARKLQAESKAQGTSPNIRQQLRRRLPCPWRVLSLKREKAYSATIVDPVGQTPDDEGNEISRQTNCCSMVSSRAAAQEHSPGFKRKTTQPRRGGRNPFAQVQSTIKRAACFLPQLLRGSSQVRAEDRYQDQSLAPIPAAYALW